MISSRQRVWSPVFTRSLSAWILFSWAVTLVGCLQPDSVLCSSGRICPAETTCFKDGCAVPERVTACIGQAEGAACLPPMIGTCVGELCVSSGCGDGIPTDGEECDDGALNTNTPGGRCRLNCRLGGCGDRILDTPTGEVCDDGNTTSGDGCSADCHSDERCGNGIVDLEVGEVCDDGNTTSGDGCAADCKNDEHCGNGVTEPEFGEQCDEGEHNGIGLCCTATCQIPSVCGDGAIECREECESDDDITADCLWVGFGGGTPTCVDCVIDYSDCHNICGDGNTYPDDGEECDGTDFGGQDCLSFGFTEGSLLCVDCVIDSSGCSYSCGDGVLNQTLGEECDGTDFGGKHCSDYGLSSGTLACADCVIDPSGCTP